MVKEVDRSAYVWGHVSVIIFHVILGVLLITSRYSDNIFRFKSKDVVFVIGILLVVISLLGLWPVLMDESIEIK